MTEAPKFLGKLEPGFEELLTDPRPYPPPLMPEGRPQTVHCFIDRDVEYFMELEALSRAVVVHNLGFQGDLSVENIADYSVKTGLVTKDDIQVSILPGPKYLIRLPSSVSVEAFIKATPYEAWDKGLSFQQWTPMEDVATVIPRFKILLDLVGVPVLLWRDTHIAKAVSQFGVYLGKLEQEEANSLESCMVAVGTDDLAKIPQTIAMYVGGMKFPVLVRPITWKRSVIYKAEDFPTLPAKFSRPPIPTHTNSFHQVLHNDEEFIPMRKQVLVEMCKGRHPNELPPELRQFTSDSANTHGGVMHEQQQQHEVKDPIVAETGQIHSADRPASQRLQGSSNTKRNLFHQRGSSSNQIVSEESRVRCTPGLQISGFVAPNDVMDEVLSPNKSLCGKQHEGPHTDRHKQLSGGMETQPPRLMQREFPQTASSNFGTRSPKRIPQQNKEAPSNAELNSAMQGIFQYPSAKPLPKEKGAVKEVKFAAPTATSQPGSQISSTDFTLKEFKFKAQQKRKNVGNQAGPSRPPKPIQKTKQIVAASNLHPLKTMGPKNKRVPHPINNRPSKRAQVQLNPEGFFEVKMSSNHVNNLASGCGFKTADVRHIISADNVARVEQQQK